MIDRDDMARAVSANDAQSEEVSVDYILDQLGIDKDGLLHVAKQRALRMIYLMEGRTDELFAITRQNEPVPFTIAKENTGLLAYMLSFWIDSFCAGVRAKHDPTDDIPGINTDRPEWIVGVTESCTNLRRFATEDEAAAFVGTLEGVEDGIYYIDPPMSEGL